MTHSSAGSVVCSSRRMVGIDTFSTVLSITTMNAERIAMPSVTHRPESGTSSTATSPPFIACRGRPLSGSAARALGSGGPAGGFGGVGEHGWHTGESELGDVFQGFDRPVDGAVLCDVVGQE